MTTVDPTESTTTSGEAALLWVGTDDRGVELEIVAAVLPELVPGHTCHADGSTEEMKMANKTIRINGADVTDGGSIDLDAQDVRLADGTRLTEAGAQELAQQALRAAGRGRPSLTAPGERSPQLRLTVPEQLREGLRARADVEHRSVSEVAREAIERYLAS